MKTTHWLLIIGVLCGLFIFRECEHSIELKDNTESLKAFYEKEKESYFAGKEISVQDRKDVKQNIVASSEDIEAIRNENDSLRKVKSIVKVETHTKIVDRIKYKYDTLYLAANLDTFIHRDTVKQYFIPKGSSAGKETLWYDIYTTVGDSLIIDSLKVREKIDVILAYKKPDKSFRFLRTAEPVVSVQSYNPYTNIGMVNNLVVKDEKSKFGKVLTSKPMIFLYGMAAMFTIQLL